MLCHLLGYLPRDASHACVSDPYRFDKLRPQHTFQQISDRPGLKGTKRLDIATIRGKNDNSSPGKLLADRQDSVYSIYLRHANVHQSNVRAVNSEASKRLLA